MKVSNGETESKPQDIGWDMFHSQKLLLELLKRHLPQGIK